MLIKVEGYRIPGHRLGMIIASPELLRSIITVCDCMQVCHHLSLSHHHSKADIVPDLPTPPTSTRPHLPPSLAPTRPPPLLQTISPPPRPFHHHRQRRPRMVRNLLRRILRLRPVPRTLPHRELCPRTQAETIGQRGCGRGTGREVRGCYAAGGVLHASFRG